MAEEVRNVFGFEPVVITGPKALPDDPTGMAFYNYDSIFYENNARRLYIMRPVVGDATTESFLPSEIAKQKDKWLPKDNSM